MVVIVMILPPLADCQLKKIPLNIIERLGDKPKEVWLKVVSKKVVNCGKDVLTLAGHQKIICLEHESGTLKLFESMSCLCVLLM